MGKGWRSQKRVEQLKKEGYLRRWVVTLNNGNTSPALNSVVDANYWILDHLDEDLISLYTVRRVWSNPNEKVYAKAKVKKRHGTKATKLAAKVKANLEKASRNKSS